MEVLSTMQRRLAALRLSAAFPLFSAVGGGARYVQTEATAAAAATAVAADEQAPVLSAQESSTPQLPQKKPATAALAEFLVSQADATESSPEAASKAATAFVNKSVALMHLDLLNSQKSKRTNPAPTAAPTARQRRPSALLTPTQRQRIVSRLCEIVERRQVSLVVATRLVKRPWPPLMDGDHLRDAQHFIKNSLKAWIVEEIGQDTLSPSTARAVLGNGAVLLRLQSVSIVGSLANIAIRDVEEITKPDALISLMWSVHTTGAHAPQEFWGTLLDRLLVLNSSLHSKGVAAVNDEAATDSPPLSPQSPPPLAGKHHHHDEVVGHMFSGLTTRQIYRLLAVLKREKWNGRVGPLRDLADMALRNIVFEAEVAAFVTTVEDVSGVSPLTKSAVEQRVRLVSDLSLEEFLSLLTLSGDFGIPFSVAAARVSDHILAPMVRYLGSVQLLQLMQIARKTRCNSPFLLNVLAARIERRGPRAPYAMPLAKAFAKTILEEADLFPQVHLTSTLLFLLRVCDEQASKVRSEEVCALAGVLYGLSRRVAPTSTVGLKIRLTIDLFCRQMDRMLQLELVQAGSASRLLEYTIVMGMRGDADLYPNVGRLLETRNVAVERERAKLKRVSDRIAAQPAEGRRKPSRRWEDQSEGELPSRPKAALTVYGELIYMFERMSVVKALLTWQDFRRFDEAFDRAGLFNIFLGAHLMKLAHLDEPEAATTAAATTTATEAASGAAVPSLLDSLPGWIEKRVLHIVVSKMRRAGLSKESTDDQVLHILGHLHCDAAKVHEFIALVLASPLRVLRNQRDLWDYIGELARRFGSKEDQRLVEERVARALF